MMAAGRTWFDRYLRGLPVDTGRLVRVAREGTADGRRLQKLPPTKTVKLELPGTRTIVRHEARSHGRADEVGDRGLRQTAVKVTATAAGGWARLVAVLTARTPAGKEIVVPPGGVPTQGGRRKYTIRMIDQATFVPKRSRFSVTVASSSSAQNPANFSTSTCRWWQERA